MVIELGAVDRLRGIPEREIDGVDFRSDADVILEIGRRTLTDVNAIDRRSGEVARLVVVGNADVNTGQRDQDYHGHKAGDQNARLPRFPWCLLLRALDRSDVIHYAAGTFIPVIFVLFFLVLIIFHEGFVRFFVRIVRFIQKIVRLIR